MGREQTIPTLDLRDYLSGEPVRQARFVETMGCALADIGFFALTHHGVDEKLIAQAYSEAEKFFALPTSAKQVHEDLRLRGQRGYTSYGREHAKDQAVADMKEFWHVGREFGPESELNKIYPPCFWPTELKQFRPVFLELYRQLETCAFHLLEAVARYVGGIPMDHIANGAVDGDSILRVIHYPPVPESAHPAALRAAAHEDINLITLLCESTDDGLELLQRDGTWLPIRAVKGQIIVDSGDMLQNLTNGWVKSTTHRVVNPGNSRDRRFSMPFFVHPRPDFSVAPLPGCVERTGGPRAEFRDMTALQYLRERLDQIGLAAKPSAKG
ncbi:MAG TPA: 2-oxoglutarate and iron-dependent oxygenase domain-containing protein [Bdellovibrionota bacterium]|jgi:isopenicillin N synthase-like dioxygenase|nr:2-oxoglutarate and iron-dependent oxygenase domain-containing protein [Bdellovibrionota bacterium]